LIDQAPVLTPDEVRLLSEVGFLAASAPALQVESERLFRQLIELRPRRAFAYIGLATGWLNRGRPEEAAAAMAEGIRRQSAPWGDEPPDLESFDPAEDPPMMQVFHGLTLLAARRTAEGQQVLGSLLESCDHSMALRLARGLMGLPVDAQG
jgi:hypothetical protein